MRRRDLRGGGSGAGGYIAAASRRSPEVLLTIQVASTLAESQAHGILDPNVAWWHTPNEYKGTPQAGALRKAMGVRSGAPDFVFILGERAVLIELKSASGSLSPGQRQVRDKLDAAGGKLHVARSVSEVFGILHRAGFMKTNPYEGR